MSLSFYEITLALIIALSTISVLVFKSKKIKIIIGVLFAVIIFGFTYFKSIKVEEDSKEAEAKIAALQEIINQNSAEIIKKMDLINSQVREKGIYTDFKNTTVIELPHIPSLQNTERTEIVTEGKNLNKPVATIVERGPVLKAEPARPVRYEEETLYPDKNLPASDCQEPFNSMQKTVYGRVTFINDLGMDIEIYIDNIDHGNYFKVGSGRSRRSPKIKLYHPYNAEANDAYTKDFKFFFKAFMPNGEIMYGKALYNVRACKEATYLLNKSNLHISKTYPRL